MAEQKLSQEEYQARNTEWLKKNHAKEQLVIVSHIFDPQEVEQSNGKRIRFNFSAAPCPKKDSGVKVDHDYIVKNSVYFSASVKPDNKKRIDELKAVKNGRYSVTYRERTVKSSKTKKDVTYRNIITIAKR